MELDPTVQSASTASAALADFQIELDKLHAAQQQVQNYQDHPINAELLEALQAAARQVKPRGKQPADLEACRKVLGEERYREIYAPFQVRATALYETWGAEKDAADRQLTALAQYVSVEPGPDWVLYRTTRIGDYSSQTSSETYARAMAELYAAKVRAYRIEVRIDTLPKDACFQIWARASSLMLEVLRRKETGGLDFPEMVRLSWERGANPRVFWPFLPQGFEAAHGFDCFGKRKAG